METTHSTHALFAEGILPGWGAVLIFVGAVAFVLWQYRREFPVRRSGLTVWVLPGLRIGIVGLLCWLLAQPVMRRIEAQPRKPVMLIVNDDGASMQTRVDFGNVARKIDLLASLEGEQPAGRDARASRLARELGELRSRLETTAGAVRGQLDKLEMGLPVGAELSRRLLGFVDELQRLLDRLPLEGLPEISAKQPDALREELAAAQRERNVLTGHLQVLLDDGPLVAREAAEHPDLLETYSARLRESLEAVNQLRERAYGVQEALDGATLSPEVLRRYGERTLSRGEIAAMSAKRLALRHAREFDVVQVSSGGLPAAMTSAFQHYLASPLDAVIMVTDATRRPAEAATLPVPVYSVLIGEAGVEPDDLALLVLEAPPLAVAGSSVRVRALVKRELPEGVAGFLSLRVGEEEVERVPLEAGMRGVQRLETEVTLTEPGARVITGVVVADRGGDAFVGNESLSASVHVLAATGRVKLVGSRLDDSFASWHSILRAQPALQVGPLLAADDLAEMKIGTGGNEFPGTAEAWEDVALAVLIGDIPAVLREATDDAPLVGLRKAIEEAGLPVLVHDTGGRDSWSAWLGIESTPGGTGLRLHPVGEWRPLHRLDVDRDASLAAWQALPKVSGRFLTSDGEGLIATADGVVAATLFRGKGRVTWLGMESLTALRTRRSQGAVNRLAAGLVVQALAAAPESEVRQVWDRLADFHLAPQVEPLRELAAESGGEVVEIEQLDSWRVPELDGPAATRVLVASWSLWHGWWPLMLVLLLGGAEYLLRRRAGRVM